uniref:Ig-like domain-containing protein n=1 Tax=Neogobius melanostomus TaxID=47308 RepID=A0A8C6WVR3_9GOBI
VHCLLCQKVVTIFKNMCEKTFDVGQTVTLQCPRDSSETSTLLFWIRLLPGNVPEFLGGTPSFDDPVSYGPTLSSIKTKQEPGSFTLSLNEANLNDTGFYYCVKVQSLTKRIIFNSATFLKIKAPDSALSVESPDLSGTVDSGDSVDLQCWVQTENAQCFKEHMVLWFRSGLDQSSPGLVYAQRNSSGQCDRRAEDQGPHKCLYTFSKSMSPSDAGTYRCAVAACGQILFGNKTKVNFILKSGCTPFSIYLFILVFSNVFVCYPVSMVTKVKARYRNAKTLSHSCNQNSAKLLCWSLHEVRQ